MKVNFLKLISFILLSNLFLMYIYSADNQTEFGVADDLTVLGVEGTYLDPDVEIKGFTVFGATQSAYTANIPAAQGNVIINGILGVSSGAYIAGVSTFVYVSSITFKGVDSIFITDGNTDEVLAKDSDGSLKWRSLAGVGGDNLGTHIATKTLDMAGYDITRIKELSLGGSGNIKISTATTQFGGAGAGVLISTHVQLNAQIYAEGNAVFNSNLNINGNLTIGDNSSDMLYVNSSDIRLNSVTATSGSKVEYKDVSGNLIYYIRKK